MQLKRCFKLGHAETGQFPLTRSLIPGTAGGFARAQAAAFASLVNIGQLVKLMVSARGGKIQQGG